MGGVEEVETSWDGSYLKYKNTVDEKLEVQCFKASKIIVFKLIESSTISKWQKMIFDR